MVRKMISYNEMKNKILLAVYVKYKKGAITFNEYEGYILQIGTMDRKSLYKLYSDAHDYLNRQDRTKRCGECKNFPGQGGKECKFDGNERHKVYYMDYSCAVFNVDMDDYKKSTSPQTKG